MFGATFNLATSCRTTEIFETLKDGSLEINSLALNNCFRDRNFFQNSVNTLSKLVHHFLTRQLKILCSSDRTIFFKFYQLRLFNSAILYALCSFDYTNSSTQYYII